MRDEFDYRRGPGPITARPRPGPVQLDTGPDLSAAAIANCALCDAHGYRGNRVCDHIDHVAENAPGRAAARAALAEIRARRRPVEPEPDDLAARQRAAAPPVPLGAEQ